MTVCEALPLLQLKRGLFFFLVLWPPVLFWFFSPSYTLTNSTIGYLLCIVLFREYTTVMSGTRKTFHSCPNCSTTTPQTQLFSLPTT
jgi:hypothetical protein